MTLSAVAVGPCFRIENQSARVGTVASLTVVVFTFFYSIGAGPVPFTLSAEVFPLAFRGESTLHFSMKIFFCDVSNMLGSTSRSRHEL